MERSFDDVIDEFIKNMRCLNRTFPFVLAVLQVAVLQAEAKIEEFTKKKSIPVERNGDKVSYNVKPDLQSEFLKVFNNCRDVADASPIVARSSLVALLSQFDAHLGNLIGIMYQAQPHLLQASERTLTFSDLSRFESIEVAREYVIEKEIESVLRKNYSDQFAWLEGKLDTPLRKGLASWPRFIEASQRRNLFVHCDGIVSSQYMKTCEDAKAPLPNGVKVGYRLSVTQEYMKRAYSVVFEIGMKLAWSLAQAGRNGLRRKIDCYFF